MYSISFYVKVEFDWEWGSGFRIHYVDLSGSVEPMKVSGLSRIWSIWESF